MGWAPPRSGPARHRSCCSRDGRGGKGHRLWDSGVWSPCPQPQLIHRQDRDEDGPCFTRMFWGEEERMWGELLNTGSRNVLDVPGAGEGGSAGQGANVGPPPCSVAGHSAGLWAASQTALPRNPGNAGEWVLGRGESCPAHSCTWGHSELWVLPRPGLCREGDHQVAH